MKKKRSMIFVVMATVFCANLLFAANLVNNPGFESPTGVNNGGPIDDWRITSTGGGLTTAVVPAPMSGQSMWFNNSGPLVFQTFDGVKLLPNRIYILTFDARVSGAADQTVNSTIMHLTGSGDSSTAHSNLVLADVTDRVISNGTFLAGWVGVRFDVQVTSTDDDPNIYHEFKFTTPATLSDPNTDVDIGITFSGASGSQIQIDNVSVEVIPEPATIGLLAILGVAFLRRK